MLLQPLKPPFPPTPLLLRPGSSEHGAETANRGYAGGKSLWMGGGATPSLVRGGERPCLKKRGLCGRGRVLCGTGKSCVWEERELCIVVIAGSV